MVSRCLKRRALFILLAAALGAGVPGCAALPRDWAAALRTPQPAISTPFTLELPTTAPSPAPSEAGVTIPSTLPLPTATPTAPPATSTPSPTGLPSQPALSGTATRRPTRTPTITPTPELPQANIQIFKPGPASKVVSPIKVGAYLKPGARGNVQVELLGEDGRLLVREIIQYAPVTWVHLTTELEFEIAAVAETGRLVISTADAYGRVTSLASVDLLLLSMGTEDLNPSGPLTDRIVIREPNPKALIQGGTVQVSGLAYPLGSDPLLVELLDAEGKPVGPTRLVSPSEAVDEHYLSFAIDVPYSLEDAKWVLLVVSERDKRIPGIIYLSSVEIFAGP